MSIAALERQLASVGDGSVEVKTYFTSLCETLAASMIGDPEQVVIAVTGPGGVVEPGVSLSLGLIVTELVINALKHAFPGGRHGTITVECAFPGPNWTLSVTDDGVGIPTDRRDAGAGLGTNIVRALARELGATIETAHANPGNRVTVARTAVALVPEFEPSGPSATPTPGASRPAA
jgi:two-component sensor histidine kinase